MVCIVTLPNNNKQLVSVVYRSPSSSENNNIELIDDISNIWDYQDCSYLLVMGEFNVPGIGWQENMSSQLYYS